MSDAAGTQANRIVAIVADLSRHAEQGGAQTTVGELAARYGTTPQQIRHDVVALTAASEDAGSDWLSSIAIQQEGDRLSVTSLGPFRRPVRLTVPELAAIQIGLATESDPPPPLAAAFAALLGEKDALAGPPPEVLPVPIAANGEAAILRLARQAIDERRLLRIKYAGSADRVGIDRTIEPAEVVADSGRYYVTAWCRRAQAWRHFRADRVLDAEILHEHFDPRESPPPVSVAQADSVEVRFSPAIARWIRERYPDARAAEDGGVIVTYHVADPQWLVRTVLQYGADAEVVAPEEYRSVMRMSLGA